MTTPNVLKYRAATPSQSSEHLSPFAHDVLTGLARPRKSVPPQWFYDERGSELFEAITELPEYYPTRTEIGILEAHASEIGQLLGPDAVLVEPGSGSSLKTAIVLGAMERPAQYLAVEISPTAVDAAANRLRAQFPGLVVTSETGDFTRIDTLPHALPGKRRHVFFPGSTLGNFEPVAARALLSRFARLSTIDGIILVGIDLRKSLDVLLPAYDDAASVTAAFNLNLLTRINRELDGTFDLSAFEHRVRYDMAEHRVEMHLVAKSAQRVRILGRTFDFVAGESIHTENSYKYARDGFTTLAASAGLTVEQTWTDPNAWF
ncbi:MAG: L-histidine N(alpha)-methyltransferase, partial [Hyphomicrobium aestuarii]|nr:L-histidine N(alpha)-methyltransferase [Hyphomicrobium aestuarii]